MSVQKLLPIAKKMGKENFLAYKNYIKTVKSGKPATVNLNLRGMTIVDTINFTIKDGGEADIKGFRNLLREIHKTYFPRAGSKDTEKMVTLSYMPIDKETNNTKVSVKTKDNDGILGESFYHFIKMGNRIVVEAKTYCEDFKMKLDTVLNLPKNKVGKNKI